MAPVLVFVLRKLRRYSIQAPLTIFSDLRNEIYSVFGRKTGRFLLVIKSVPYRWIALLPCWCRNKRKFAHIVCIKMEVNSQRRKILLFQTTNMAAMTSCAINLLFGLIGQYRLNFYLYYFICIYTIHFKNIWS